MLNKQPGILFKADGALNLTLPGQPIVNVETTVQEDSKNHYKVIIKVSVSKWNLKFRLSFQVDMSGVVGHETDFKLTGTYVDMIKALTSSQDLKLSVTGSTLSPIEVGYSRQLNQTIYEAQFQAS